jgi:hypothetical protein
MVGIGLKPQHTKGFFDLTPQSGLKHKIREDVRYYFSQFLEKKGVKCTPMPPCLCYRADFCGHFT